MVITFSVLLTTADTNKPIKVAENANKNIMPTYDQYELTRTASLPTVK